MTAARRDIAAALVDSASQPLTQTEVIGLAIPQDRAYALGGPAADDDTYARASGKEHM